MHAFLSGWTMETCKRLICFSSVEPVHGCCRLNKRLLKGFLANAKALIKKEGGEIHVTHRG